jgi:NAD-dependent DNA ligase
MAISVKGKTVVLTGTLTGMERKEAEKLLTKKGAKCTGSVSKNTDMVFAGTDAGSKVDVAESLDIPVYSEKDLFAIIGKPKVAPKKPAKKPSKAAKAKVAARKKEVSSAGGGLKGKTVVVTGTLSKPRAQVEALLKKAGAKVTGSVSAMTNFLVVGVDAGSKLATAMSLGVQTVTEAQLPDLLKGILPTGGAKASSDGDGEGDRSGEEE